jgi:CBS domain-containing protein
MAALTKGARMTTVADVMTRGVRTMAPSDTVVGAAQAMDELNVGVIPVCEGSKLVGMVTDRDIVVRGVAQESDTRTLKLADVMSPNVRCAKEDDDIDDVLTEMANTQIRRMPVVDGRQRLVGIVTLGDIAAKDLGDEDEVAVSLGDISSPAQPDRSAQSRASGSAGSGSASGESRRRAQ